MKPISLLSMGILLFIRCGYAQPSVSSYSILKATIESRRLEFQDRHAKTDGYAKKKVINEARDYLFSVIINDMFDAWYGTPWDFNGTTTTPGQGTIACGYFVTTVLQDAGFEIPRVKWAQEASETMIMHMTTDIKRFSNRPVDEVSNYLKQKGDGLYIVGLDVHTGFIFKSGDTIRFVHSNYYNPDVGVMAQDLDSYNPFQNSSYRVVGKILGDEMMRKWILGIPF